MRKSQSVVIFYFVSFLLFLLVTSAFAGTKSKPRDQSTADSDFRKAYAGQKINILMSAGLQTSPVVKLKGWFEELTGIQASIEVYDETTTREKAVLDFTSRTGNYDALMTQDYFFDEFQAAGWFEPLDDYIKNHADPKWLNLNDLPKTSLSYFTKDGKLYALPFTLLGGVLFYNEEVFKRNNLKPPETIENMEKILKILKEKEPNVYGIAARASKTFDAFGASIGFAYAYGGRILNNDNEAKVASKEMIAGISKFAELLQKYGAPDQAAMSWPETLPLFMNGKVAMMVEVSHCGGVFEDPKTCAIAGKIGYALPPKGPSGNRVQWTYTDGFTINKDSKHKEATWLFMQWRSSFEENMKEVQDGLRYDVTSNGVLSSKEYRKALEARGILDYAKILVAAHEVATTVHLPRSVVFVKIAEAFQTNVSLSVAGEIDATKAMQNAQKEIEKIMNEANY